MMAKTGYTTTAHRQKQLFRTAVKKMQQHLLPHRRTSVSTVLSRQYVPAWDTPGPLACTACHGFPPSYAMVSQKRQP